MQSQPPAYLSRVLVRALLPGLLAAAQPRAAVAPAPVNSPRPAAAIVELNPFVVDVSRDTGYAATETLSGTRMKTEVKDLASPLTILTEEFLSDIGATNFSDIVEFMPGAETYRFDDSDLRGEQTMNGRTFTARGFRADSQAREFFTTQIALDSYNTGPISFNRGPNSNLFGIGSPGGSLSFGYRQVNLNENSNYAEMKFDSYSSKRFVYRRNQVVVPKRLGFNLAALDEHRDGFRNPQFADRTSVTFGAEWRPTDSTTILLNRENGRTEICRPYAFTTYNWTTPWLAAGGIPSTPTPRNINVTPLPASSANTSNAIESFGNAGATVRIMGTDLPIYEFNRSFGYGRRTFVNGVLQRIGVNDNSLIPLETNAAGVSDMDKDKFNATLLRIQQRLLPGLYAELAGYRETNNSIGHDVLGSNAQTVFIDPNPILADGTTNPYFGKPFIESSANTLTFGSSRDEAWRFSASYDTALPNYKLFGRKLGKLRVGGFYSEDKFRSLAYRLTQKANPGGANLRHRLYIGERNGWSMPALTDDINQTITQAAGAPGINRVSTTWEEGSLAGDRNDRGTELASYSFVAHALLFDDFLSLVGGYRHDKATASSYDLNATSSQTSQKGSRTFGAVVHFNRRLSGFANYGENFNPDTSGRIRISGDLVPPNVGKSRDFGLRANLFENRISASITFYETKQVNQIRNSLGDVVSQFDDIWDTIGYAYQTLSPAAIAAAGLPATAPTRPTNDATAIFSNNNVEVNGGVGATYGDNLDSRSKGMEFELVANPTKNWRLSWSVSKALSTVSAIRKASTPYYEQYLPVWRQYVNAAGTIVAPSTNYIQTANIGLPLSTLLNNVANLFDQTNAELGGQRFGNRAWSTNLVTRYAFSEGLLTGWNVGGSVRWRDQALVGYASDPATRFRDPSRPAYSNDYWTMDAFVGHTRRILKNQVAWSTILRVRNLNHRKVWTSLAAVTDAEGYPGTVIPLRYVVMEPLAVELTSTFRW